MSDPVKPTLAAALVEAQRLASAVGKESSNNFHGYKYASAEAIMAEARAALNAAGLATVMESWMLLPPTHSISFERVSVTFRTFHASSSGELVGVVEYHIIPEKGRPLDKATATALTYAEGYYLRGLLCLPRVDPSEDVDQRDDLAVVPAPISKDFGQRSVPAAEKTAGRPVPEKSAVRSNPIFDMAGNEVGTATVTASDVEMGTLGQSKFFHAMRARLKWTEDEARAWFASQPGANGCAYLSETPKNVCTKILEVMKQLADKADPTGVSRG